MSSQLQSRPTYPRNEHDSYYPIRADITFRILDGQRVVGSGTGKVKAMSRTRLVLDSEKHLSPGVRVEVSMAWPALLDNRIPLKLVVMGQTVAFAGGIAVDIQGYEFRTQPVHSRNGYRPFVASAGRLSA